MARRWLLLGAFVLLVLYIVSPALGAPHFEVMSAQVHINAIAANEHRLGDANLLYPIHTEYFYLSRIGVVYLLQLFSKVFGDGDVAFRALTVCAYATYLACSVLVARRYSQVGPIAAAGALLMTPAVICTGFFFNDNVVSAAFGMAGLALAPRVSREGLGAGFVARGLAAGFCLGMATLARTDGVLLVPVAAALAWIEARSWRPLVASGAVVAAGLAAALAIPEIASGASVLQILAIDRFFEQVHDNMSRGHLTELMLGVLVLGLPNLVLIPLGAALDARANGWRRNLVLIAMPAALFAVFMLHALETRMFFPLLAPFFAMHGGRGLEWAWAHLKRGASHRLAAGLVSVLVLVTWLAPPIYTPMKEGPKPVVGELWQPLLWSKWQAHQLAGVRNAERVIAAARETPDLVVVTQDYTSDGFLRLRLWQAGFRPLAPQAVAPGCGAAFTGWRRGDETLLMVRTENPHQFVPEPQDYVEALEISTAFRCPLIARSRHVYAFGSRADLSQGEIAHYIRASLPGLVPAHVWFGWPEEPSQELAAKIPANAYQPLTILHQHLTPLSPAQVEGLVSAADREVARDRQAFPSYRDLPQIRREWGYRYWRPSGA